jgi:hypothetical protein
LRSVDILVRFRQCTTLGGQECPRSVTRFQALAQPFKVGDGLLENVAEDIDVNDRADGGALVGIGHLARGAVIVVAQLLEMGAEQDPVQQLLGAAQDFGRGGG